MVCLCNSIYDKNTANSSFMSHNFQKQEQNSIWHESRKPEGVPTHSKKTKGKKKEKYVKFVFDYINIHRECCFDQKTLVDAKHNIRKEI